MNFILGGGGRHKVEIGKEEHMKWDGFIIIV